ncbi:MAG TPA: hypothetical protein VJR26_14035 [Candidatus Acidoferrales bacterium]|nr:hypothetical protein [Candidatus Acidoferrales bacterium]
MESVTMAQYDPESKQAWAEIEGMWRGKRSLVDLVRAGLTAEKKKKS